jgi:hypothetical protein
MFILYPDVLALFVDAMESDALGFALGVAPSLPLSTVLELEPFGYESHRVPSLVKLLWPPPPFLSLTPGPSPFPSTGSAEIIAMSAEIPSRVAPATPARGRGSNSSSNNSTALPTGRGIGTRSASSKNAKEGNRSAHQPHDVQLDSRGKFGLVL